MSKVLPYNAKQWEIPAIMDGRKTVKRWLIKPQPTGKVEHHTGYQIDEWYEMKESESGCKCLSQMNPPYQPLDIMYVRETWWKNGDTYFYKAGCSKGLIDNMYVKWRPSIHMPKEAARIWLKVTDVRVERLQEITPAEVVKEGAYEDCRECLESYGESGTQCCYKQDDECSQCDSVIMEFERLWNSTIKKSDLNRYGWEANSWVWVIEFERCGKPESHQ